MNLHTLSRALYPNLARLSEPFPWSTSFADASLVCWHPGSQLCERKDLCGGQEASVRFTLKAAEDLDKRGGKNGSRAGSALICRGSRMLPHSTEGRTLWT